MKKYILRIIIFFTPFMFLFVLGEIYFRYFYIKSDGIGNTIASKNWYKKYWNPINNFGFRDIIWNFDTKKKKVFILGDSFIAGSGIQNIQKRISGFLRKKNSINFEYYNIAKPGWDTKQQIEFINNFPHIPEILIYSYYLNDIGNVEFPKHWYSKNIIIRKSAFINYLYWKYKRRDKIMKNFSDKIKYKYLDDKILLNHFKEINEIIGYTQKNNIKLIIILFPFLLDLENQSFYIMYDFFKNNAHNYYLINVKEIIKKNKIPIKNYIVNFDDPHPSIILNKKISEEIEEILHRITRHLR